MTQISDQTYLKNDQYKDSSNLEARIALHRRFGTNSYGWFPWVFDHFRISPGYQVLEIGCGPGRLWQANLHRIPQGATITLGDLSTGMVRQARETLHGASSFQFLALDAQAIPAEPETFDIVVANHMLYHVPDVERGVAEINRVLKPGGRLFAATNGLSHMQELHALIRESNRTYDEPSTDLKRFSLENGLEILGKKFLNVEVESYPDDLVVTDVEPLIGYIFSMWGVVIPDAPGSKTRMEKHIRQRFAETGKLLIHKSQGLFSAQKSL
jgi:ubiquinone/menaquinone biosynthesis C-methylase UbiE